MILVYSLISASIVLKVMVHAPTTDLHTRTTACVTRINLEEPVFFLKAIVSGFLDFKVEMLECEVGLITVGGRISTSQGQQRDENILISFNGLGSFEMSPVLYT